MTRYSGAFCIMQHQCDYCGDVELIWNSRDGVTPFYVTCRKCSGASPHVRWREDIYAPNHVPAVGSRIFVDLTAERKRELNKDIAANYWNTYTPSREKFTDVEALASFLDEEPLALGEPDLIEVVETDD